MYVVTGDETGLVRLLNTSTNDVSTYGEVQSRSLSVLSLAWLSYDQRFALLRVNGDIETYEIDYSDPQQVVLEKVGVCSSGLKSPIKIVRYDEKSVLCYNAVGDVNIVQFSELNGCLDEAEKLFGGENCLRGPVEALQFNNSSFRLACGGKKNDLQVWDTSTQQLIWKAKNVPHDEVRLEVPIWITGIAFMPTLCGDSTSSSNSGNVIATGTGHKHIRLYDTRMQRQPCQSWGMGDFRVTTVIPSYQNDMNLYVADCAGGLLLYDMRNGKRTRTLNGFDGSIRDAVLDGTHCSHMAAVSLDRYVKVYDCRKNSQIFQAYLKNRLNCTLLCSVDDIELSNDEKRDSTNESDDEDVVEDFMDSSDSNEDLEQSDDESDEVTYHDVEPSPSHKKRIKISTANDVHKRQKAR